MIYVETLIVFLATCLQYASMVAVGSVVMGLLISGIDLAVDLWRSDV